MKRTRSAQLAYCLSRWRELYLDFRNQPIYCLEREISIEDAKRMFPDRKYTVFEPMTVHI